MIYILGSGYMANEYAKVLNSLNYDFTVVGRTEEKLNIISSKFPCNTISGGYKSLLEISNHSDSIIINCLPVEILAASSCALIDVGVKAILIEKPGALSISELVEINEKADSKNTEVRIGYNRRFYQSFIALENYLLKEHLLGISFEMTEWGHVIKELENPDEVKQKWILANTSHVIDIVLYFSGELADFNCFTAGSLTWHSTGSTFVGAGVSKSGILISYCGFWEGPGRWSIDFVTENRRFIYRPMEKLQIQNKGSIGIEFDDSIDYTLDEMFKPGLYLQTKSFMEGDYRKLTTIKSQIESFKVYNKIGNYKIV